MRLIAILPVLFFVSCATPAEMASRPADRLYQSEKSRELIVECLLNRMSAHDIIPQLQVSETSTLVTFVAHGGLARPRPILYQFTVTDRGAGSHIEARTIRALGKINLSAAELCF